MPIILSNHAWRTSAYILSSVMAVYLAGCRPQPTPQHFASNPSTTRVVSQLPLPLHLSDAEWEQSVLASLEKRIVGRRETWGDIERIVTEISPTIREAANAPELTADFEAMAQDNGVSLDAMRELWITTQEADLMMESGGRDDAISPSDACGVAQWLASTGRANGLSVDAKESQRLTAKINPLKTQIAWYEYLALSNAKIDLPNAPQISQAEAIAQLPTLRTELEFLKEKRRNVDERFVPREAVFAQTRYLVKLYQRFPGLDWLYQAYHGGEGGANRTLKRYLGSGYPGNPADAIRYGNAGNRLNWEILYKNITPQTRPDAFDYVYGRSDDHRHYWWKLRVCREAIARYRRDKSAFEQEWLALLPGRSKEVFWYPDAQADSLPKSTDRPAALASGKLHIATTLFGQEVTASPQTLGIMLLVSKWYRANGGKEPLSVDADWLPEDELARRNAFNPSPKIVSALPPDRVALPLEATIPSTFDFHTTGLAIDIRKPQAKRDAKILDYVLGWMEDREMIWRLYRRNAQPPCHHFVPNPTFADALRSLSPNKAGGGAVTAETAGAGKTVR